MTPQFGQLWVYLQANPLGWLTATLIAYWIGVQAQRAAGGRPYVNPVAIAVVLLVALLVATGTPYQAYFQGAQFVHFLLGPAIVALAIPLYENWPAVKRSVVPMIAALLAGAITAVGSAVGIAWALGASAESLVSIAPKSVTTPVAMGIAEKLGGIPSLTAVLVILTGIIGAIIVTPLLNALGLTDWRARGFAAGVAAHGLGTARAFQVNDLAGTFAGIGMALNALATALIVPVLWRW
jgi:predicted murein hydrolase (TIGR00659 family)